MSGRIRVVLEKNTTYDGEVTIDNGGRQVADDFELEVSSVDAGSDGMQADGTTIFTGSMTIRGISVKIAGVGMPGTVTVEGAKARLDYYGTRADDGSNVTVTGSGAQAALHTGEGADSVNAEAQDGGQVTVDTGAGADTVTADVTGAGSAEIVTGGGEDTVNIAVSGEGSDAVVDSGEGADTVNAQAQYGGELTIDTGSDADAVRAKITDGGAAQIDSGAGDDRADVRVSTDSEVALDAGAGDDVIGLTGVAGTDGRPGTFARVDTGAGDDTVSVAGQGADGSDKTDRSIAVDLGNGEDRVDVDLSVAAVAGKVDLQGGDGGDRLHVMGELDADTAEDQRATGTAESIDLAGTSGRLTIAAEGVGVITDSLSNKRTVEFTEANGALNVELPFTNYIYRGSTDGNVTFRKAGDDLLMTNVIIAPDDRGALSVGQDAVISAEGLQLVLAGRAVQVDGTLKAGLVRIEAVDGTDRSALLRVNDGKIPLTNIDLSGDYSLELLNISDVAKVTIGRAARVYSEGDIIITSTVEQEGGIINIGDLTRMNLVDLKVARATVDLQGRLYAGYDLNTEKPTDARGSATLLTSTRTSSGFDENGDPVNGLPLAITLANMDSIVHIASDAEIHATDSIRLNTNADMRVATRSDSMKSLPLAIAAAYVTVDSRVTVDGLLEAGSDVTSAAGGNVEVTAIADRGDQKSISGGYVSLAVVIQNVKAELGPTARVAAGRDVNVKSAAREKVDTLATTGSVDEKSGAPTAIEEVFNSTVDLYKEAYNTLIKGWLTIKGLFTGKDEVADRAEREAAAAKLEAAISKVSVSDHAVSVDEASKAGGDLDIKSDNANGRVTNTVTVTPRAGYRVKSITWRGLNAGDIRYTSETTAYDVPDDSPRTISFVQSTKNVTVFVEYEEYEVEEAETEEEAEEDEADPFADTETNNNIVVDEMLNRVTAAATDDYEGQAEPVDAASRTVALTLPVVREGEAVQGAILTYETEEDGASLRTVAPGQELRLVVNPGEGKLLKAGSLKVSYQRGDTRVSELVTADDHGRYFIDIPEDVDVAAGVKVYAEFVDETQRDEAEPQRGTQIAGSVAVTITENNNQAIIDATTEEGKEEKVTGAQVSAGRDVNVSADSVADIRNAADGTAVTQEVVTGTQVVDPDDTHYPWEPQEGNIPVEVAKLDKLILTPDRQLAWPGDLVKVTVGYNDEQHIKAGTLKAVLTSADGTYREEIYMSRNSDFTYTFRMPAEIPADLEASDLSVSFEGEVVEGATGAGVTTSTGAAVALTVSSSHNRADIKGTVDAARDVSATAVGEGAARTETRAGYSEGSMGIGGAVSVQVAAMDSRARTHKTAAVQLDGELSLNAENDIEFYVDADGSGSKRIARGMGIGAGLSMAFDSAHALAAVEDGAALVGRTAATIGGLTLSANQRLDDQVSAAAGAGSTGTSLVAALALDFVNASAKARLGDIRGEGLKVRGDVTIAADNAAAHSLISEGAVAGKGTGVGAAISLSMVKDRANATLAEDLIALGTIRVDAVNESAVRNVNIASASGGRIPFRLKIGDDIWWKLITATAWLYSIDNTLPEGIANIWIKYHPPGLMTDSSMGIAGAAGANIQTSAARAEILDGIDVTTAGKLAVTSRNRTEAQVKGDASTTDSGYGIGIGAGLNIVNMDNIAFVGNGQINAASLAVTATTKRREVAFGEDSFGAVSGEEAEIMLTDRVGEAVNAFVDDLIREVGLKDLPGSIMDSIVNPLIDSATEEILGLAGLGEMFTEGFIDEVCDLVDDNFEIIKWSGVGVLALALETDILNVDSLLGAKNAQAVVDDFKAGFNKMLIPSIRDAVVGSIVTGNIGNILSGKFLTKDVLKDIKDHVKENLKPTLADLDKGFLKDLGELCGIELNDKQLDAVMKEFNHGKTKLVDVDYVKVAMAILGMEEEEKEEEQDLNTSPLRTQAGDRQHLLTMDGILDEYADGTVDTALAGFDAVLQNNGSVTNLEEGKVGDLDKEAVTIEVDGQRYTLADAIIKRAEEQNIMLTDDQMAVLRDPTDLLAEADRASAGEHLIDTQAVSGAGSDALSVAGSGAVTKLDFTTKAQVGYEKLVYVDPETIREDYSVDVRDYLDEIEKPYDKLDDDEWVSFRGDLYMNLQVFANAQLEKYEEYEKDLAAYRALKKKKDQKEPKKKDYKLDKKAFEAYTGIHSLFENRPDVFFTGLFDTSESEYQRYQKEVYNKIQDYVDKQVKMDKQFEADKKRYADSLKTNAEQLGDQVTVTGDAVVVADSERYVNNVASASLNGKGNASANASAADSANSDVGDSSAATNVTENRGGSVRMTTDVGATSTLDDANKVRPRIYIDVKPGFALGADEDDGKYYADYSFNAEEEGNDGGVEEEGRVELRTDASGRYYIDTRDIKNAPEGKDLYITLGTKEVLRKLTLAAPVAEDVDVEAGAVSAEVKGRGLNEDDELAARAGDTVVVTINKKEGRRPEYLGYTYTDRNGKAHTVEINPDTITDRDLDSYAFAAVTQNKDEIIVSFRMPDADENGVTIQSKFIDYDETPGWLPNYSMKVGVISRTMTGFGWGMGVGASIGMLMGSDDTAAVIGLRQKGADGQEDGAINGLTAGTVTVTANSKHGEVLSSVSGTDPLSGQSTADTISATSLDASAVVDMLDTSVRAVLDKQSRTAVTGYNNGNVTSAGDVTVTASEDSETSLNASAFSAGRGTAVGATVALNMATYDTGAEIGAVDATGRLTISADNRSKDNTTAVATAVGADVIRVLRAAGVDCDDEDDAREKADEVAEGYENDEAEEPESSNKDINDRLDANRDRNRDEDDTDEGEATSDSMSISSNALRSQGVSTDIAKKDASVLDDTMDGVNLVAQVGLAGGAAYMHVKNFFTASKTQLAAAVAVSQAAHTADVTVGGDIHTQGDISATADNTADFAAMATAAAMSILLKATSVSGGVAVIDNKNEANVNVRGDLVSEARDGGDEVTGRGDITLRSTLTQNMGEDSINRLAAQSVSGSVAGYDSSAAIGAAISVVKSKARTTVNFQRDENSGAHDLVMAGNNIDIEAIDQSRLSARAGGVSVSMGSSVGMGIGGSIIKSNNVVSTVIGDRSDVTAASFNMNAEKKEITEKDYRNLLEVRNSDSELIKYRQKDAEGKEFSSNVNLSASKIMKLYDGVNKYSFQNNYAEAIGASAELTPGKVSLGGSFAVVLTKNDVKSLLGDHVTMNVGGGSAPGGTGNVAIRATDRATDRLISGGLSIAPSSASVGAAVTVLKNEDTARAEIGEKGVVNAGGDIVQTSEVGVTTQAFTAGVSMAISIPRDKKGKDGKVEKEGGSLAMAGAVNYIVNKATATTSTDYKTSLKGGGDTVMTSKADSDMMALVANSSISIGGMGSAVGASANIITDKSGARTTVGLNNEVLGRSVDIGSDASSQLITGVASQSAQATGDGSAFAAGFNVNHAGATAETYFDQDSIDSLTVRAARGDVNIHSNADAWALTAAASLPGGVGTALGGSVNVNFFDRKATILAPHKLHVEAEQGNVRLQSSGKDTTYMLGALMAGSVTGSAVGGNFTYLTEDNEIRVDLGDDSVVYAGNNALIETKFEDFTAAAVGTIALANAAPAVGLTGIYITKDNDVQTLLGNAAVTAGGKSGSAVRNLLGEDVQGIYAGANAEETQYAGAAGIALAGTISLPAQTVTLVNRNNVIADASRTALTTYSEEREREPDPEINCRLVNQYGGVAQRGTAAQYLRQHDASYIQTLIDHETSYRFEMETEDGWVPVTSLSQLYRDVDRTYGGGISVIANEDTRQIVLAGGLGFGLTGAVGASVTTIVSDKTVKALAHDMTALKDIQVSADNEDDITQLAFSGGVGLGVGVEIGAAIQVLKSRVNAHVGSDVMTTGGSFSLTSGNTASINSTAAVLAGSAGYSISPVGVVTYFKGESTAILGEGSRLSAAKDVTIQATGDKFIWQNTIGAAFSGKLGISGAVNLQIVKDKTLAKAEKGTDISAVAGSLDIGARGDYRLRAASAAVAGSKAAVAVNAVVTLLRSTTLAELAGKAAAKDTVNIHAASKRDVIDGSATLAAGQAGVGVSVLTLVSGAKLDQDAADILSFGDAKDKNARGGEKTFDAKSFMANIKDSGASKYYSDTLNGQSLENDLNGNGHNTSELNVGHKEGDKVTFDGQSGYRSGDFDDDRFNDAKSEKGRGEGLEASDTKDVASSKNLNDYDYDSEYRDDPNATKGMTEAEKQAWEAEREAREAARAEALKDVIAARIAETASVTQGNTAIDAEDRTAIDLIGLNLSFGEYAGVGATSAIAVLHSNVISESLGDISAKSGDIRIEARSVSGTHGSEDDPDNDAKERTDAIGKATDDVMGDISDSAIRVIGLAAGIGTAGVGVAASVALTDNVTRAILGGSVTDSGNVTVNAEHKYGKVIAATVTDGSGIVGVSAAVGVAQARGELTAAIARGTTVRTRQDVHQHDVNVTTDSDVEALALTVTAGLGLVSVNAGVALAKNTLQQNTLIGAGADVAVGKDLTLSAVANMDAKSYLIGLGIGGIAASLNAGVTDLSAKLNTSIGESLEDEDGNLPPYTVVEANGNIRVAGDVVTKNKPLLGSLALGGFAVGGNVLLAFNNTESIAKIDNSAVKAVNGGIDVLADMEAQVEASMANVAASIVGSAGLSVNYAELQSVNHAAVSNSLLYAKKDLNILAGSGKHNSSAVNAETLSATVGLFTLGLNAGVARNRAYNFATLSNDRDEEIVVDGNLNMSIDNTASAKAGLIGLKLGAVNVAGATVVAMNDATSRINVDLKRLKVGKDVNLTTDQVGETDTDIKTGGGSVISADASVALSYGRTNSLIDFAVKRASTLNNITAKNNASDITNSGIRNQAYDVIAAQVMYGAAYSTDIFNIDVKLTGDVDADHNAIRGEHSVKGSVNLLTDYKVKSRSVAEPSAGGLPDITLAKLRTNMANARNTAYAGANFEASKAATDITGNVTVNTKGAADTYAEITSAKLTIAPINLGASIARSDLSMVQAATMRAGGDTTVGGAIDVQSVVRKLNDEERVTQEREELKEIKSKTLALVFRLFRDRLFAYTTDDGKTAYFNDKTDVDKMSAAEVDQIYARIGSGHLEGRSARATAMVGTSGGDPDEKNSDGEKLKIALIDAGLNWAIANENMTSTAAVLGGAIKTEQKTMQVDNGEYVTKTRTVEDLDVVDHYKFKHLGTGVVFDPTLEYVYLSDGNYYGKVKEGDKKFVDEGKYVFQSAVRRHFQYDLGLSNKLANQFAWQYTDEFKKYDDPNQFERIPVYATYTEEYEDWVSKWEDVTTDVDVYDLENNHLTAGSMNIFSGAEGDEETAALARSDGAKTFGFATAGNLKVNSETRDSFSALFEGMKADIGGEASLKARGQTRSNAIGYAPGRLAFITADVASEARASVGTGNDQQTVGIVIGEGATLNASKITLDAANDGSAKADLIKGNSWSLANINISSVPTNSWYNNVISIGRNATLNSSDGVSISSTSDAGAESVVEAEENGLLLNLNMMMGKNYIKQDNNVDFGDGSKIFTNGNIDINALTNTAATAETNLKGGGLLAGNAAKAQNDIERTARVNIGRGVKMRYNDGRKASGTLNINAKIGAGADLITTNAEVRGSGFVNVGDARAYNNVDQWAEIIIADGVEFDIMDDINLLAHSTSYLRLPDALNAKSNYYGIQAVAVVDSKAGVPLPNGVAKNTVNANAYVDINQAPKITTTYAEAASKVEPDDWKYDRLQISWIEKNGKAYYGTFDMKELAQRLDKLASGDYTKLHIRVDGGEIFAEEVGTDQTFATLLGIKPVTILTRKDLNIDATNRSMTLVTDSETTGKGLAGVSNSTARNDATITNAVWIDNATLWPDGRLNIWAESGGRKTTGENKAKLRIKSNAYAKLSGIGKAVSEANITGTMINQIRTNDESSVELYGTSRTHLTNKPESAVWQQVEAESKIKKVLGIPLAKKKETEILKWYVWDRCDFCHEGRQYDLSHSEQDTIENRYKDAFDRAMLPIDIVASEVAALRKSLSALQNINRTSVPVLNITRARFGVENNALVSQRYALDVNTVLNRDAVFTAERLNDYWIWTNTATRLDTYLLPNATRLYAGPRYSGLGIQYIAEVFQYDLLGDGRELSFDIVTALNENAFQNSVMPMGDVCSLDFATGTLMLPAKSEYELYLHEVSAKWMMERLNEGFLQALITGSDDANSFALNGGGLPGGSVSGGPVYGGEQEGWRLYWLSETPETVQDPDQTLIFLLVNDQTDEVDAFRTTANMLERGEKPVDVSVYLFRDARADMRDEERYDLLFFDTPAGEQSIIKLMTDLADGSKLVMPKPLRIVLRAFSVNGAAPSSYSLNDHFYVLLDGSKGGASLANLYRNTFDGNTFESDYMVIEDIASGDISITLKQDQPIWPEISGQNAAEDVNGARYTRVGEVWYPADRVPKPTPMLEGLRAA